MNQPPLNPDALEAAEDELWAKHIDHEGLSIGYYEASELVVSTYLAAALPEVTEREQLTALPDKIVLEAKAEALEEAADKIERLENIGDTAQDELNEEQTAEYWLYHGTPKTTWLRDLAAQIRSRP